MKDLSPEEVRKNIIGLAITGFRWQLYSTISVVIMQLIVGIILARLLPPEDFGLFGYAMIFIGLISIFGQAGIAPAIIQRQKLTNEHIKVGFTLSLSLGLLATVTFWVLAGLVLEGKETSILRIISLTFFLSGFGSVSSALLEKKLDFYRLFWVEILSYGLGQGLISVVLAVLGFRVWSLALGALFYSITRTVILLRISPHPIGLMFKRVIMKELMHFGVGMSLARFANYSARNGDYFIIGKLLQPQALGLYSRAFQLVTIPTSYFASLVSSVLFPAYAMVQDCKPTLKKGYYLSVSVVSFVTLPSMIWLFFASEKLIPVVYGSVWNGSIPSLQLLCGCGFFGSIYTLGDALARAKGAVYAQFARHSIYAGMVIVGGLVGIRYGIEGVAIAVSLAVFMMYIFMNQLSLAIIGGTWLELMRAHIPGLVVGIFMASLSKVTLALGEGYIVPDSIVLLMLIISFLLVYFLAFTYFPIVWLREIPEFLVTKCSALLPRTFVRILSYRLNRKMGLL